METAISQYHGDIMGTVPPLQSASRSSPFGAPRIRPWQIGAGRLAGWWFGTWILCFHIGNNNPNWRAHIFQRSWNHQPVSFHLKLVIFRVYVNFPEANQPGGNPGVTWDYQKGRWNSMSVTDVASVPVEVCHLPHPTYVSLLHVPARARLLVRRDRSDLDVELEMAHQGG